MRDVLSASRAGLSAGRGKKNKEMNDERNEDFSRGESDEWPQSERSQHNVEISNFIKVASPAACCHRRRYRHSASLYYHASADKVENKCVMHYSSNNSNNTNNSLAKKGKEKQNLCIAPISFPSLYLPSCRNESLCCSDWQPPSDGAPGGSFKSRCGQRGACC